MSARPLQPHVNSPRELILYVDRGGTPFTVAVIAHLAAAARVVDTTPVEQVSLRRDPRL